MSSWREQEFETQVRSRVANESIARAEAGAPSAGSVSSFRCECGDQDCSCAIQLTLAEYEAVRADDTHFAIATNHENPERDLVEEHERFAVVETVSGEALKLARKTGRKNTIGGNAGSGPEDPLSRQQVAGDGGSSTRFRRSLAPAEPCLRRTFPADSIELLNGHRHVSPRPQSTHTCPACDMAVFATDDAVHQGGELYHQDCARRRPEPA